MLDAHDAGAEARAAANGLYGMNSLFDARVVNVHEGVNAALVNLTITGGTASYGGGVVNLGELTITGATITDMTAMPATRHTSRRRRKKRETAV